MQGKISMDLLFCQSENGCSLDEIVQKLAFCLENKAFADILRLILEMIQDYLMTRVLADECNMVHCCDQGHFTLNGSYERRIRTSLGEVKMSFVRVRCSKCGKSFVPIERFLHMEKYQTRSNELEKLVLEAVTSTNYRRAAKELERDGKIALPHQTVHDWVMRTDCDEIDISPNVVGSSPIQIMPDGTGFKGEGCDGKARKGDLKIVIGVSTRGEIFSLGAKAGVSWQEISQELKDHEMKLPDGSILICDGELGLSEAFAEYASEQQRCHWHVKRDLYHMMNRDGGKMKDYTPMKNALAAILAIELPQKDFKLVSEEDKKEILERMLAAESKLNNLITCLNDRGFGIVASYLSRAKIGMFGYVRRWLKWGLVSPKASSMVERVMRELGRRIKKIAYGWSDRGVTKVARIILKRFANSTEWEDYWKKRMNCVGNFVVSISNYQCFSQNFGQ